MSVPEKFDNVTVKLKANVYFDGGVTSHRIEFAGGMAKTIGMIRPGTYHFDTGSAERMEIIAGSSEVKLAGQGDWKTYAAGSFFDVPAKSGFDIKVASGLCEYLCSFE